MDSLFDYVVELELTTYCTIPRKRCYPATAGYGTYEYCTEGSERTWHT